MRTLVLLSLVSALVVVPATVVLPAADACQPLSWYCPLNGQYYYVCGSTSPPPVVKCAQDTLRDLTLP